MRKKKRRKPRKPGKALAYVVISTAPRVLRLKIGTKLRQGGPNLDLYLTENGKVYSLTVYGLRPLTTCFTPKNNYCKRITTGRGHNQGEKYLYVKFHRRTHYIHTMMAYAWLGKRSKNKQVDHINGNIFDNRKQNLRYLTRKKNSWCGGIIKRLRNAAKKYHLPLMDPSKRTPEDMLALYDRFEGRNLDEAMYEEIERQKVLQKLRESAVYLHDPSLDPKNIEPERLEKILSTLRVDDTKDIMEYEMTHHCEC